MTALLSFLVEAANSAENCEECSPFFIPSRDLLDGASDLNFDSGLTAQYISTLTGKGGIKADDAFAFTGGWDMTLGGISFKAGGNHLVSLAGDGDFQESNLWLGTGFDFGESFPEIHLAAQGSYDHPAESATAELAAGFSHPLGPVSIHYDIYYGLGDSHFTMRNAVTWSAEVCEHADARLQLEVAIWSTFGSDIEQGFHAVEGVVAIPFDAGAIRLTPYLGFLFDDRTNESTGYFGFKTTF